MTHIMIIIRKAQWRMETINIGRFNLFQIEQGETGRHTHTQRFHSVVHATDGCNVQAWAM